MLAPYVEAGVVSVTHEWPNRYAATARRLRTSAPFAAYLSCDAVRWLAFIDIDEFLFSPVDQHLPNLLRPFADAPAVVVNWVSFGSGGHIARPAGGVLKNYTRRGDLDAVVPYAHLRLPSGEYRPINAHVKSIVDPRRTLSCASPPTPSTSPARMPWTRRAGRSAGRGPTACRSRRCGSTTTGASRRRSAARSSLAAARRWRRSAGGSSS